MTRHTMTTHRGGWRRRRAAGDPEAGVVSVIVLVFLTVFIVLLAVAVDVGGALVERTRAHGAALEGARAGVDNLQETTYFGHADLRTVDAGAGPGAACGIVAQTQPGAACTATLLSDGRMRVTVADTYPTLMLGIIGIGSLPVRADATVRPAVGADTEEVTP